MLVEWGADFPWWLSGSFGRGFLAVMVLKRRFGETTETENGMAYVLSHFWPGATEEQYREQLAKVHSNNGSELPDGQIYHVAGPTDGGFLVVAVWD